MATEPVIAPRAPELSHGEKVNFISHAAASIGAEKGKFSPTTNGLTLEDVAMRLRLSQVIPHPDTFLKEHDITLTPGSSAFRKGEILTAIAASALVKERQTPESIQAAALLISTSYATQAEARAVMIDARTQNNATGAQADSRLIGEKIGQAALRQLEIGKLDRLVASTVASLATVHNLPPQVALDLARALTTGQPPRDIPTAALVTEARIMVNVAKSIRNAQPKTGIKPDDIPYHQFGRLAVQAVDQARQLNNQKERQAFLKRVTETGRVPDRIGSLHDILRIVDENPEIRAVSFDLYDTLVQWTEDFADRYGRYPDRAYKHLQSLGIHIPQEQFRQINERVWHNRWANFQAHGTEVTLDQTIKELISNVTQNKPLATPEYKKLHHALTREWYKLELENAVAMPGAKETLEQLKARGIKICLTSNASWSQEHVRRVLNRFRLLDYFDRTSISAEIGKMKKPHIKDFFHHSWDKLGVPYQNILHVGDNPNDDVIGARNAGARATHYHNPLAYNRLEIDKIHGGMRFMRKENQQLYAETVVSMQRNSLETSTNEWIKTQMQKKRIPKTEQERVFALAKEVYNRSRDIFGPLYINLSEQLLNQLNSGEADVVLSIARDGLPTAITTKLLLNSDPERYPNVKSDQLHYIHASRAILKRISIPSTEDDHKFRDSYIKYLLQKENFAGKKILITDNVTAGTTYNLLSNLLKQLGAAQTRGLYLDMWRINPNPELQSFLQTSLSTQETILDIDAPLVQMESLLHGPHASLSNIETVTTKYGTSMAPKPTRKILPQEILNRGLSQESILFMNDAAVKGLHDAVKIRYRSRLAKIPDPTDKEIAQQFVRYLQNIPIDDLLRTVPLYESGKWYNLLTANNPFLSPIFKDRLRQAGIPIV